VLLLHNLKNLLSGAAKEQQEKYDPVIKILNIFVQNFKQIVPFFAAHKYYLINYIGIVSLDTAR
jgi:hypothetical protein